MRSETVKLIIEISKDYYEILKCEVEQNETDYYPFVVIGNGIPLDDVKAEIEADIECCTEAWHDPYENGRKEAKEEDLALLDKFIREGDKE